MLQCVGPVRGRHPRAPTGLRPLAEALGGHPNALSAMETLEVLGQTVIDHLVYVLREVTRVGPGVGLLGADPQLYDNGMGAFTPSRNHLHYRAPTGLSVKADSAATRKEWGRGQTANLLDEVA